MRKPLWAARRPLASASTISLLPCTLGSPLGAGEATQGTPRTQLHHLFCNSSSESGPRTAVRTAGTKGENLSRRRDGHWTQSGIQFTKEDF